MPVAENDPLGKRIKRPMNNDNGNFTIRVHQKAFREA
jgi:hypothetical protein